MQKPWIRTEQNDFNKKEDETNENDGDSSSSSDSDNDDDPVCKYYLWKKGADEYLTKIQIASEILELPITVTTEEKDKC